MIRDLSVIIPTFNERENIGPMIVVVEWVLQDAGINGEIIVVDDSSWDGTIPVVMDLLNKFENLHLVVRSLDPGLSQSVVEGFAHAQSDIFLVMDADFSHPPNLIRELYGVIKDGADIAIGSRYAKGGGTEGWPLKRRIISRGATLLARSVLLLLDTKDPGSGFFAVRKAVVDGAPLRPQGYKILLEILGKGRYDETKVKEVPYVFRDRAAGTSKLKGKTMVEFVRQLLHLKGGEHDVGE